MQATEEGADVALSPERAGRPFRSLIALTARTYLTVRLLVSVAMAIILSLDLGFQYPLSSPGAFASGLALFTLVGVVQLLVVLRVEAGLPQALWTALPFDLLALGLLVFGSHGYEDALYPVAIGLALFYSLVTRSRLAWVVSGLTAAVYLVAHTLDPSGVSVGSYLFLTFKALAIVGMGYSASWLVGRQAKREALMLQHRTKIARLNAELRQRISELNAISEITEIIHASLDFEQVGPAVMDVLLKTIDVPACSLFVIDRVKAETLFSASKGLERPRRMLTVRRGTNLDEALAAAAEQHLECVTLVEHNRLMVVFGAESSVLARLSRNDSLVLQAIASELAVAVENSQLYKLTKRLAVTDDLTSLYNYRYLQERLDDEVERARRYGKDLSLLMIDADDFKGLNDTHGHIVGDRVLAEMGQVMRSVVREVDVVARYGGEEFSIVLPETDAAGAFVAAEKIREAIDGNLFADDEGERTIHVTCSIGLASFPVHASDKESLLRESDEALYQAKHTGRNRVRVPLLEDSMDAHGKAEEVS